MTQSKPVTFGVIIGNRGFFPTSLCEKGRERILNVLEKAGHNHVVLSDQDSLFGSIESLDEARKCAALFAENRDRIDGVIVTLPNFGDERAIANALRWAGLNVPVLIHAFPDDPVTMKITHRRDSFCGKMSCCNNLRQYGILHTLTTLHTDEPESATFAADLADFARVCRIVRRVRTLRIGALGARPAAFNTVRYSEKLLEGSGISVETIDLYELLGQAGRLADDAAAVMQKLADLKDYVKTGNVDEKILVRMSKFGVAVDEWIADKQLDATAIQCWTAMEEFFGIVPCACMSMMSNKLISSACEVDVTGAVAMAILAEAGGSPSALVDWNNNYGDDPDKGVVFHCSNLPRDVFELAPGDKPTMGFQEIIAGSVGEENTYGTLYGRIKPSPFTYLRLSTDDHAGRIRVYTGQGDVTADPLETFGGYGVVRIPALQKLLRYICENGFEHHVAINLTQSSAAVQEALEKYLGWDVYHHTGA